MNNDTSQNMIEDKYGFPLDLAELKKSNILVSGTNQQGKSRASMFIADIAMREGWQIVVFDNVGHWKRKSSIPFHYMVSEKTMKYVLTSESLIYDISLLLPSFQKEFCENVLADLWEIRVRQRPEQWLLVLFEEFQLYAKNVRGNVSQNILRIMSVGANHKIRCLGITPDLSLIDCAFIRLAQQRYHFKLGNEPNAKRRFNQYYGKDYTHVARHLTVGCCLYVNKEFLQVHCVPLFQSSVKPKQIVERKPKTLWQKVKVAITGVEEPEDEEPEFDDIDDESEIEIDEAEEYPEEWGLE